MIGVRVRNWVRVRNFRQNLGKFEFEFDKSAPEHGPRVAAAKTANGG